MRRGALAALVLVVGCRANEVAPDRGAAPPRSVVEAPSPLATAPLANVRVEGETSPFLLAEVGGEEVRLLVATKEEPQRHRPQIALHRLAKLLALAVVPETAMRREPLSTLLAASDPTALAFFKEHASTSPGGVVSMAVSRKLGGTRGVGTVSSHEAAAWAALGERTDLSPDEALVRDAYVAMLVLDHASANLFRRSADVDERGVLSLSSNRTAFTEHPDPQAVDQLFARLRRVKGFPPGLGDRLASLSRERLDATMRAGDYEDWVVHERCVGETWLRLRQSASLVWAVEGR